jgi:hypothetical protein
VSKIGGFSDTDIEDISLLIEDADKVTIDILTDRVLSRKNMSIRVRERFIENLKIFRVRFHV